MQPNQNAKNKPSVFRTTAVAILNQKLSFSLTTFRKMKILNVV